MAIDSRLILAVVTGAFMSGCAPLVTQSPGQGLSPVNAISEGEDKHLILKGHDVVAYFTDKVDRAGSPGFCGGGFWASTDGPAPASSFGGSAGNRISRPTSNAAG